MAALTQKEFEKKIFDLVGNDYIVLGEYTNRKTKIELQHNISNCKHKFMCRPDNFLTAGNRCPACGKISRYNKKRKTDEQFKKEVFDLVGNEYTLLSKYGKSNSEYVLIRHNCDFCNNHEYKVTPNTFLNGGRCPICARKKLIENRTGKTATKTDEQFKKEVFDLVGNEYTVLGEYVKSKEKIKMIHNIESCNETFFAIPVNFLQGARCPKCAKKRDLQRCLDRRHSIETVKSIIEDGKEYLFIDNTYINGHTPISIKHISCDTIFKMRFDDFKHGQRCPFCNRNKSKNEDRIREYFKENSIEFKEQYRMKDCRDKRTLPFDFAIFKNSNLIGLLEYDGEHHRKIINRTRDKTKNQERLETQIRHDKIKNEYCEENNIPLLRISYKDKKELIQLTEIFINKISTTIESTLKDGSE